MEMDTLSIKTQGNLMLVNFPRTKSKEEADSSILMAVYTQAISKTVSLTAKATSNSSTKTATKDISSKAKEKEEESTTSARDQSSKDSGATIAKSKAN